jgi:serine/threonine protein phosphatase PrpC
LRSLGFKEELDVDTLERELQPGDRLLLCCDGLWSVVDEEGLIKIINQSDDLQKACDALVEAANEAGGPDNISCILIEPEK